MHPRILAAATVLAALPLSACIQDDQDFGYAIRQNASQHIVDARPVYAGVPQEGSDGVRLVDAQRRYLTGTQKDLLKVSGNSQIGGQGGATAATTPAGAGRSSAAP